MFTNRMLTRLMVIGVLVAGVAVGKEDAPERKKAKAKPEKNVMAQFDTDQSGTLSLAEFTAMKDAELAKRKAKMGDKWNEDKAAKMPKPEELFKRKDTDNNGELSADELKPAKRKGQDKGAQAGRKADKAGKGKKAGKAAAPAEAEL